VASPEAAGQMDLVSLAAAATAKSGEGRISIPESDCELFDELKAFGDRLEVIADRFLRFVVAPVANRDIPRLSGYLRP
jgi:hypothetical protein